MQTYTALVYVIQICYGITRATVLNGELYAQRFQKLIYLHDVAYMYVNIVESHTCKILIGQIRQFSSMLSSFLIAFHALTIN